MHRKRFERGQHRHRLAQNHERIQYQRLENKVNEAWRKADLGI